MYEQFHIGVSYAIERVSHLQSVHLYLKLAMEDGRTSIIQDPEHPFFINVSTCEQERVTTSPFQRLV